MNRLGPVELRIRLVKASDIAPAVQLNGDDLDFGEHAGAMQVYTAALPMYDRGSNRLDVELARESSSSPSSLRHTAAQIRSDRMIAVARHAYPEES